MSKKIAPNLSNLFFIIVLGVFHRFRKSAQNLNQNTAAWNDAAWPCHMNYGVSASKCLQIKYTLLKIWSKKPRCNLNYHLTISEKYELQNFGQKMFAKDGVSRFQVIS